MSVIFVIFVGVVLALGGLGLLNSGDETQQVPGVALFVVGFLLTLVAAITIRFRERR